MIDWKLTDGTKLKLIALSIPLIFVFLYWFTGASPFYFLGAVILTAVFAVRSDLAGFCMLFTLLPLENMLRMEGAPFSLVTLVIVILLIKLILNREFRMDLVMVTVAIAMLFLLGIYTVLYGLFFDFDNLRFMVNMIYVSSLVLLYRKGFMANVLQISKFFIWGAFLLLVFSLIHTVWNLNIDLLTVRLYGLREDPNYIAVTFSIATSLILISLYQKRMNPLIGNGLILFFFVGILLTQSRGGLLAFSPNLIFFVFLLLKGSRRQLFTTLGLMAFVAFFINKNQLFVDSAVENVMGRIDRLDSDAGSGRLEIWQAYMDLYSRDIGQFLLGPYVNVYPQAGEGITVAHNLVLGTIAKSGGINMIFILAAIFHIAGMIRKASENVKLSMLGLLPLVTMLVGYFFLDAVLINVFLYMLVLSFMLINSSPVAGKETEPAAIPSNEAAMDKGGRKEWELSH